MTHRELIEITASGDQEAVIEFMREIRKAAKRIAKKTGVQHGWYRDQVDLRRGDPALSDERE